MARGLVVAIAAIAVTFPAPLLAQVAPSQLPTGGVVAAGQASIVQQGATLNINQTSNRAALDWQSFNVGSAAQVNFNQPSSASTTLNRVQDANPSQIFGKINAPGQVFLSNPNGIYFAPGASVNVGGLVATTHRISLDDFMAGKAVFQRNGATASVENAGDLNSLSGYIALLAPQVRNKGVVTAQAVVMASGETVTLNFDQSNILASVTVTKSQIAALVENSNAVLAPGGLILLSAQAANHLQGGVVKNSGNLEATGLISDGGRIILDGSDRVSHTGSIKADAASGAAGLGGSVIVIADIANHTSQTDFNGSISVKGGGQGGDGGFVETSASHFTMGADAKITAAAPRGKSGTWLIDPYDYTIDAPAATVLVDALANANVIVTTTVDNSAQGSTGTGSGNINVNAPITSSSGNRLTLTAASSIIVNAPISVGSLVLNAPTGISLGANMTTRTDMTLNGNVSLLTDVTLTSGISHTYVNYTDFIVPTGVTSISAILVGGAGGQGGDDGGNTGGDTGRAGRVIASFNVTAGEHLYLAPGRAGVDGGDSIANTGGAAGGTNAFGLASGGSGGNAGPGG